MIGLVFVLPSSLYFQLICEREESIDGYEKNSFLFFCVNNKNASQG